MKCLCFIVAGLLVVSVFGIGCTAHDRYRQMTYRRAIDGDILGFQDDVDAAILLDRPSHLSPWLFSP